MTCTACGASAVGGARFCANCGQVLRAVDDQRRVVTVVFADLVGFTTLAERLDPERVKYLVDRCFDALARDVAEFGGQVDKIVGDAMVAHFGATTAHEDDAERAVRAALRMHETLAAEVGSLGEALQMRIGVNTGEVLVGAMRAAGNVTVMGDVVNTASRLQTAGSPGEVLVGPATYAATSGVIAYEDRGMIDAKGRDPVDAWLAVAPTLPPGHRSRRDDVPLVGREQEMALLHHAVGTSITHGRPLLVLLVGDVGMGKSRIAGEVGAWAEDTHGAVVRSGRCVPYGEANVWWPIADALRDGLGVDPDDDVDTARRVVTGEVSSAMARPATSPEVSHTIDGLLTVLGYDPPPEADPSTIRDEAAGALGVYARAIAARQPVVLELSDLHWADDAVLSLVDDLFAQLHHHPATVVATTRPSLLDRWTPRAGRFNTLVLHVDPLGAGASTELLHLLTGGALSDELASAVVERSGGNPFFLEELAGRVPSAEALEATGAGLPETLRGLLAARLDDLSPTARVLAQDASVIGPYGPVAGLREMAHQLGRGSAAEVDAALEELSAEEILDMGDENWSFRSDLLREVAYQTLTKADRAKSHYGIARYMEHKVAADGARPVWLVDQLAHHYTAAVALGGELGPVGASSGSFPDLTRDARRWVVEAARRAHRDRAVPTARKLYEQALGLLGDGDADATEAMELRLQVATLAAEAWDLAAARVEIDVVTEMATALGDEAALGRALIVRGAIERSEGDTEAAAATLTDAAHRFSELDDEPGRAEALRHRALVEILGGRTEEAERSASEALAVFEAIGDRSGAGWAHQNLAWTAFVSGRLDDADAQTQAALDLFTHLADRRGLAWSMGLQGWIRFQQGRVADAAQLADQVAEQARTRNDPWASGMMVTLQGAVRLWSGATEEAVDLAGQARHTFIALGDSYGLGQAGALYGRALVMAGRVAEGFAELNGPTYGNPDGAEPVGWQLLTGFARLGAAIQVGEPERASDVLEAEALARQGGDDPMVMAGLAALQCDDVAAATAALSGREDDAGPNLTAARVLLAAVRGTGDAPRLAEVVCGRADATYHDRMISHLGVALWAAAQGADAGPEARRRIDLARREVGASSDRVAEAVVELAASRVADRLGTPDAADLALHASVLLDRLGITAHGWSVVFDRALNRVRA